MFSERGTQRKNDIETTSSVKDRGNILERKDFGGKRPGFKFHFCYFNNESQVPEPGHWVH
jgi:hypothetical protein